MILKGKSQAIISITLTTIAVFIFVRTLADSNAGTFLPVVAGQFKNVVYNSDDSIHYKSIISTLGNACLGLISTFGSVTAGGIDCRTRVLVPIVRVAASITLSTA